MSEEVEFIRMGSGADFVNSGRVRIKVRTPKKGTKYKMEDQFMWVRPETLKQLQADGGETAVPAEFTFLLASRFVLRRAPLPRNKPLQRRFLH